MSAKKIGTSASVKKNKVLVTGADGFIGSHLVEHLLESGYPVRAFVFYNSFDSWGWLDTLPEKIRKELDVFAGDVRDPHSVKKAMSGCDTVMHLAALIGIPYSYQAPDSYIDTNIKGTLHILQAARELGITRVLQTSTSEVYGTARFVPIHEGHPLQAQSPYSASKIGADHLALSFHHSFGLPVTVVRPFNTYGPRQSARAVIPTIISQLAHHPNTITLGSLHPTRDFSFVKDTVRAFTACLQSPKTIGEVINFGSGFEISIGDLASRIAKLMKIKVRITSSDLRIRPAQSEVERLCADIKKAKTLTGWTPDYAQPKNFDKALQATIDWFTQPKNLQLYKVGTYSV